jgi:Na+/H+-dicarboxylate symporter
MWEVILIVVGWTFVALFLGAVYQMVFHPLKTVGAVVEAACDARDDFGYNYGTVDKPLYK